MTRKEPKPGNCIIARDLSGVPCWYEIEDVIVHRAIDGTDVSYIKVIENGSPRFIPVSDCFDTKADCRAAARSRIKKLAEEICTLLERTPSVKSIRVGAEHVSIYIKV